MYNIYFNSQFFLNFLSSFIFLTITTLFSLSFADFLTKKGIKTIGTDACSIDSLAGHELAPAVLPPAHLVFLGAGIPQVEDLRNLSQLPRNFFVTIAPLKLARSSGAPARVFAFV